jgi:hypothetical protein
VCVCVCVCLCVRLCECVCVCVCVDMHVCTMDTHAWLCMCALLMCLCMSMCDFRKHVHRYTYVRMCTLIHTCANCFHIKEHVNVPRQTACAHSCWMHPTAGNVMSPWQTSHPRRRPTAKNAVKRGGQEGGQEGVRNDTWYINTCMHAHAHASMNTCMHACLNAYIHIYMSQSQTTHPGHHPRTSQNLRRRGKTPYIHTNTHIHMHAHINSYIHRYDMGNMTRGLPGWCLFVLRGVNQVIPVLHVRLNWNFRCQIPANVACAADRILPRTAQTCIWVYWLTSITRCTYLCIFKNGYHSAKNPTCTRLSSIPHAMGPSRVIYIYILHHLYIYIYISRVIYIYIYT